MKFIMDFTIWSKLCLRDTQTCIEGLMRFVERAFHRCCLSLENYLGYLTISSNVFSFFSGKQADGMGKLWT